MSLLKPDVKGTQALLDVPKMAALYHDKDQCNSFMSKVDDPEKFLRFYVCGTVTTEASWKNLKALAALVVQKTCLCI